MAFVTSRRSSILVFAFVFPAVAGSTAHGIKNFLQVDQFVYRGAQPTREGYAYLARIGVKTVIDLREPGERSKAEESAVMAAGMKYVNVPMTGLTPPTDSEISKILGILEDQSAGAAFVHCMRGADRTGAVIAAYRIDHDRWDNGRALREAKDMGMSFFQFQRKNFIRTFEPKAVEARATTAKTTGTLSPAPVTVQ